MWKCKECIIPVSPVATDIPDLLAEQIMVDNPIIEEEGENEPPERVEEQGSNSLRCKRFLGIGLCLIAAVLFCSTNFVIKVLYSLGYPPFQQMFYRGICIAIISGILMYKTGGSLFKLTKQDITFVKYRTIVMVSLTTIFTLVLGFMAASTMVVIFNTNPIYTSILSKIFLKEKYSLINIVAIATSLVGLLFIVQPALIFGEGDSAEDTGSVIFYVTVFILIIISIFTASLFVYTRVIKAKINAHLLNFIYAVVLVISSSFFAFAFGKEEPFYEWRGLVIILALSLLMTLAHTLLYLSYKYEKPTVCAIAMYSMVLFTYIAEITIFGLELGIYDVIGGTIIMITTVSISLHKVYFLDK